MKKNTQQLPDLSQIISKNNPQNGKVRMNKPPMPTMPKPVTKEMALASNKNDSLSDKKRQEENQRKYARDLIEDGFKNTANKLGEFGIAYLPAKAVLVAPSNFFTPYVDVVKRIVDYVQDRLSMSEQAGLVSQVRNNPVKQDAKATVLRLIDGEIVRYEMYQKDYSFVQLPDLDKKIIIALVCNEIIGLGPLEPLFQNTDIREIICNGPFDVQVEIEGAIKRVPSVKFRDKEHLGDLITRLFGSVNKEVSRMVPLERARLFDNSRVFAVDSSVTPTMGPSLNIRRHTDRWVPPERYLTWNSASKEVLTWIGNCVYNGLSVVVSGGTGTGKALSLSTPIPTPEGFVKMGDLHEGDVILDGKGKPTTIKKIYPQGEKTIYKVVLENGLSFKSDKDHNWLIQDKTSEMVKTSEQIKKMTESGKEVRIPLLPEPITYSEEKTYKPKVSPYILGLYLLCGQNFQELYGTKDYLSTQKKLLKKENSPFSLGEIFYTGNVNKGCEILPEEEAKKVLEEETLKFLELEKGKESYLLTSLKDRETLVKGFLSKGTFNKFSGYTTIEDIDEKYILPLSAILTSLGIKIVSNATGHDLEIARGTSSHFDDVIREAKNEPFTRVKYVEICDDKEPMQCLTVDSETHTFLCGWEHTITHNTTLLSAITGYIANDQRVVTLERNIEMKMCPGKLAAPPMEVVPAKASSAFNGVDMLALVEASTQMRPDCIVLGEITGPEAYEFLNAANSGHQVFTTIHSNSCNACVSRFVTLTSLTGLITGKSVLDLIAEAVDIIIQISRFPKDGSRKIVEIAEVNQETSLSDSGEIVLKTTPIWRFEEDPNSSLHSETKGTWVKVGELSPERVAKHRLDNKPKLTFEELEELYQGLEEKQ